MARAVVRFDWARGRPPADLRTWVLLMRFAFALVFVAAILHWGTLFLDPPQPSSPWYFTAYMTGIWIFVYAMYRRQRRIWTSPSGSASPVVRVP